MKKYALLFIGFFILLPSCKDKNMEKHVKQLTEKIKVLQDSICDLNDNLKVMNTELEGYKLSPEKLCASIDELKTLNDTTRLFDILDKLKKYHPESDKIKIVENYISGIRIEVRKKAEEEKKKRMAAVSKLKKRVDDVQGITWYYNPYFTHYDNVSGTSIYMGKSSSAVWLRLKMSYAGENWIFFKSAYLSYDGNTKFIDFDEYKEKHSDNDGYGVWEWIDIPMNKELLSFLRKMADGKKVKMQLLGEYGDLRNLSYSEKQGIKAVLLAYDVLRSEPGMTTFEDIFSDEDLATE